MKTKSSELTLALVVSILAFLPLASAPEAAVHPGLYQCRNGRVYLSGLEEPGFGYRIDEINRALPEAAAAAQTARS